MIRQVEIYHSNSRQGLPEFYLYKKDIFLYRTGPWNGVGFSGMPTMQYWNYVVNFIQNRVEVAYSFKVTNNSIHTRITLTPEGLLQMFTWIPTSSEWNLFWILPTEDCDIYGICGSYSYCDTKTSPKCNCIRGIAPMNATAWALGETFRGCVRKSRLSCHRDGFCLMKNMKLPETSKAIVDKRIGLKECEQRCSKDCNCTGFANMDIRNGGSGCVIWTGEFRDMRNCVAGGQDLYVRIGLYN